MEGMGDGGRRVQVEVRGVERVRENPRLSVVLYTPWLSMVVG